MSLDRQNTEDDGSISPLQLSPKLEQLLSRAVHDLRSPLNASLILAQLLLKRFGDDLDPEARRITKRIVAQLGQMGAMITAIDQFVRTANGSEKTAAVPLDEVMLTALANLKLNTQESGTESERSPLPIVVGDEEQLVQVFQNVLANSIRYEGTEPLRIKISAKRSANQCTVSILDNGVGFEQEYAETIFEPFMRLHGSALPGSGLGLTICKNIVEHHNGRICAESKPGEGAAFYITLPLA
jgi:two-component system, chemotaxis family, sensor kinase Cph1